MTGAPPTFAEVLDRATAVLRAAGVPEPARDSRELLAVAAVMPVGQVWRDLRRRLPPDAGGRFEEAVARRAAGEPLAYVTGIAGFRTLELVVDRRVLIPRPETEGLVDLVLAWARARWGDARWGRALDVATGSGCIALSLAVEGHFERIVGIDNSGDALAVARANSRRVRSATPIDLREGDLLAPVAGQTFDVVVSNPPYVSAAEYAVLESAVRDHEPRDALVSPDEGMTLTRRLLEQAAPVLAPGGLVAIEVDCRRALRVERLARELGWGRVRVEPDLFGRDRFLLAERT